MKTKTTLTLLALFALSTLNHPLSTCRAATVTITPNTVSNTYSGQITLQVAGLSAGGSVVVQKFLDLNTNGVINGNDWLVQQFTMTDGQPGMAIAGVTNFNVPGDTDGSANGQITARLNFNNGDFMQKIPAKYLFKVSGNFTPPVTNVFVVTNLPWAQKITGNVISNGTSTTVSNAMVLLFSPGQNGPNGPPVAAAVANNAGSYTVPAPPGTYLLAAFRSNFLANFGAVPVVTLNSSATVTTNISVTNATASISGKMVDAANANIGLPGILVPVQANGMMGVGFTDTNGNFSVGVRAGQWSVKGDDTTLIVHGYLGLQNGTNVNAGGSATIPVPKATALIYGSVKDNLGNPLSGIDVYANNSPGANQYQTDGYTDANGNYVVGVLGGDSWWQEVDNSQGPTNYVFTQSQLPNNSYVTTGTAVLQDFAALFAANRVSGNVKFNGTNLGGVWISGDLNIGGTNYHTGVDTDGNGNYSFNVANGAWNISMDTCGAGDSLDNLLGSGNYVPPANQTANITGNNVTDNFLVLPPTNQIVGSVKDSNNNPIVGVGVYADATIGSENYEAWAGTDNNGNYALKVVNGNWTVSVLADGGSPCGNYSSLDNILGFGNYNHPASQGAAINNRNATNNFIIQSCSGVQILTTSLPDGRVGASYDQWLSASSCGGSVSWSLNDPWNFPSDLSFDSDGHIYGTPATMANYNFSVHADDGSGHTADQGLSLNIAAGEPPTLNVGSGAGQVLVFWPAAAGTNYTLQVTTNLATGPWVTVTNAVPQFGFAVTNKWPAAFFRLQ